MVAAVLLLLCGAPAALAGSVTQPGDTMGSAQAPIPPGIYYAQQANYGCTNTRPHLTCPGTVIPLLAWSTPWKIFGGSLAFATAPLTYVNVNVRHVRTFKGLFNPFVGADVAWDLGHGWNAAYVLGAYVNVNDEVAYNSSLINQRLGVSYLGDGLNLTANVVTGIQTNPVSSRPQTSPCPYSGAFPTRGCNPDFVNVDLTATKKFGKWEVGSVGFYATDASTPVHDYHRQSKAAIGGLVGYWTRKAIVQFYVTSEVYERNYGGHDTRAWLRLVFPLGNPPRPPPAIAF